MPVWPERRGSASTQPASASTPRAVRRNDEGSFVRGSSSIEVNRRWLQVGSEVDVGEVDVDVDVVTGAVEEVAADEALNDHLTIAVSRGRGRSG